MRYPYETQARSLLRLIAPKLKAADRMGSEADAELRACAAGLQQISEIRPTRGALLRWIGRTLEVAGIDADDFERACASVDAGEREAMAKAEAFMRKLRHGLPLPRLADVSRLEAGPPVCLGTCAQVCDDRSELLRWLREAERDAAAVGETDVDREPKTAGTAGG